MTTLRNLVNTVRDEAQSAQAAASTAKAAAQTAVAPVQTALTETQHEVERQGDTLAQAGTDLDNTAQQVAALENAVDTLILDALMGGV